MKHKIKQKILAMILCIAMILTSVNLTSMFNNNINAASNSDSDYVEQDNTRLYLYKNGDECSSVTGGWSILWKNGGNAYASKDSTNLHLYSTNNTYNNWSFIGVCTNKKIDLKEYTKIVYVFDNITMATSGNGGFNFCIDSTNTADHSAGWYGYHFKEEDRGVQFDRSRAVAYIGEENTTVFNIDDITDSRYVYISLSQGTGPANDIRIKEVYLTKESTATTGSFLVINPNGGSYNGGTEEQSFYSNASTGETVKMKIDIPTRTGYTFKGWTLDSYLLTEQKGDGEGGVYVENSSGGTLLYPSGNISNAFIPNTFSIYYQFAEATKDVLTAQWVKNDYTLTINPNGGTWNNITSSQTIGGQNGTIYNNIVNPTRTGYRFKNWTLSGGGALSGTTYTFGSSNATLTANWEANTNTKYVVNHYQMKVDGSGYALKETENKTGTTASTITIANLKKIYTGFTYEGGKAAAATTTKPSSFDTTTTVLADGTRVINLYYSRNQYTVSLTKGTGISSVSGAGTYYYGASVTINATASTGYSWSKWTGDKATTTQKYTFTMPASNVSNTANTTINSYTLTINPNGGTWNSSTSNSTFTLNYKATKTIANPTRTGYTFSSWTVSGTGSSISGTTFTMGSANATLTAKWTARTDTVYKVNHYLMNTDGSTYTLKETESLKGTTDTTVTPAVKTYEGFTSPATQSVLIKPDGTAVVNYYYSRNKYTVTYIDVVDSTSGKQLGKSTGSLYYGVTATGATKGVDTTDNKYYKGYYYSSCTTKTVTTSGATVYRIFKLQTTTVSGSVNWNDKSNAYNSRPEVTITLLRNGTKIDTVTGLTSKDNNSFSFAGLQKYNTSTGEAYVYTVKQSEVISLNNPEDQYTSTQNGNNFTNTLGNTSKVDPEPEWVGFEVSGSIIWDDYEDKFGTRPNEITINLYQNGKLHKTQIIDKNTTGYSFVNLDKYDDNLNPYTYKVEEMFIAKALTWDPDTKTYKEIDAYTITVDGFDFSNKLVETENPIIEVKPEYTNSLTIKLDFNDDVNWFDVEKTSSEVTSLVTLKQMETLINDGTVSYTSNYNGMEYNAIINEAGVTINNIPSGKYEIVESNDNTFILEGIDLQTTNSISVVNENNKWYLIIAETNQNQTGTISLNMNVDSFNGVDDSMILNNLYSLGNTSTTQVMMLSMFSDEVTVPEYVEPITYTITYKDCDVIDDTKYSENNEATLKDCEIEGFLGWSESSEAIEPQYIAGDKVNLEKDLILYPVIETSEQSSEETTEKEVLEEEEAISEIEESSEIEETTEETVDEEETSETKTSNEIEESEENNDSVENSEETSDNKEIQNDNIEKEELSSIEKDIKNTSFSE